MKLQTDTLLFILIDNKIKIQKDNLVILASKVFYGKNFKQNILKEVAFV